MTKYKKLKCFKCGHIQVSQSIKPKCSKCGCRRLEEIDILPVVDELQNKGSNNENMEINQMTKDEKPPVKNAPEEKTTNNDEVDDVDSDMWG